MKAFKNTKETRLNKNKYHRFVSRELKKQDNFQQSSQFEEMFIQAMIQHRNQEAKQVKIGQFERESLATLARKFELSAELLALESNCPNVQGILRLYVNELKSAIESKLKAA